MINKTLKLSELAEIGDGNHSSNYPKTSEMVNEGVPFLRSGNIQDGKIIGDNLKFISPKKHQILKKGHIKTGDILFTNRGEIGKIGIVDERFNNANLNSQVAWIRVGNQLYNRYLYYYLSSLAVKLFFLKAKTGTALQQITIKQLKSILISFPVYSEQKLIVAKLDAAFKNIDLIIAKEKLNKANIIALDENLLHLLLKNIDIKNSTHTLLKLIDMGWIESHLDGNHGGDYPKKSEFVKKGVPYLSAKCIVNGEIRTDNQKYLTEKRASKIKKGVAINDDVLFAHNASVGPTTILKTSYPKVVLGTSLTYYRCNKNKIYPQYLLTYMKSKYFKSQYEAIMRQATRNQVPITKQRQFTFIIPDYEQQVKIANAYLKSRENIKNILKLNSEKIKQYSYLKSAMITEELKSESM